MLRVGHNFLRGIVFQRRLASGFEYGRPQFSIGPDLFTLSRRGLHGQMHKMVVPVTDDQLGFSGHSRVYGVAA